MSEVQLAPDVEERTAHDLTAFQQHILTVLGEESQYGSQSDVNSELLRRRIDHGWLYPNLDELDELDERGSITKRAIDLSFLLRMRLPLT